MEVKINVGILMALGLVWASLTWTEESAALDPRAESTAELAHLEDYFATHPADADVAQSLADAYLQLDRPELAIAVLNRADGVVLERPSVAHRLARAYENAGRVDDALATTDLAIARCARSLGTRESQATSLPRFGCTERTYAALDVQRQALRRMQAWGVTDPRTDDRADRAYTLAIRSARVATR